MASSKLLDKRFREIILLFENYSKKNNTTVNNILCYSALYSKRVKKYESMQQGKLTEELLVSITGANELNTDGKESCSHYGNCDFTFNELHLSMKSSFRQKGIFNKDGNVGCSSKAKIFDASRKSFVNEKELLSNLLFSAGYEIPIIAYLYELETNKGVLIMTSLQEIACLKNDINLEQITPDKLSKLYYSIENLFEFNKSAHFLLPLKHVYNTAKHYGRILEFEVSKEEADAYVEHKQKQIVDVLDLIL